MRNTLNEKKCDFWPGIASNVEMVATTRPYYRSTYMFVTRASDKLGGLTLDDARLRTLRIGVQITGGTVTLDDGSKERIRCRASYAVAGAAMNMTLTCASDAYKFNLQASVVDQGGVVAGTWTESSRNVGGSLQGRGGGGNFEVLASAAGFNANILLRTVGTKQSVVMRADSQFRGANIFLSR